MELASCLKKTLGDEQLRNEDVDGVFRDMTVSLAMQRKTRSQDHLSAGQVEERTDTQTVDDERSGLLCSTGTNRRALALKQRSE